MGREDEDEEERYEDAEGRELGREDEEDAEGRELGRKEGCFFLLNKSLRLLILYNNKY